jgi:hypothetical protein
MYASHLKRIMHLDWLIRNSPCVYCRLYYLVTIVGDATVVERAAQAHHHQQNK